MNILDVIILICLVPAIIQGLRKGFISQAISSVTLIAGVWASAKFANLVGEWLSQHISASEQTLKLIAFALVLVVVFIALGLISKLLTGLIKFVMLGWLNRILGVAFGLMKSLLILCLLMLAFNAINGSFHLVKPNVLDDSILYPILKSISETIFPYLKSLLTLK